MRKKRYWFCENCGNVYHRFKRDERKRCHRCGGQCRKARKWPSRAEALKKKWQRKTERESRARLKLRNRHSKNRTTYGSVLKISKATKVAWKNFLKAKQRRTFESRGRAFLEALEIDLWSCPHHRGRGPSRSSCGCSGGGVTGVPKLQIDDALHFLGRYGRGFSRPRSQVRYDFYIKIQWDQNCRSSTLLHEVIHWFDDLSRIEKHSSVGCHTGPFFARLNDLAKRLNFELDDGEVD